MKDKLLEEVTVKKNTHLWKQRHDYAPGRKDNVVITLEHVAMKTRKHMISNVEWASELGRDRTMKSLIRSVSLHTNICNDFWESVKEIVCLLVKF